MATIKNQKLPEPFQSVLNNWQTKQSQVTVNMSDQARRLTVIGGILVTFYGLRQKSLIRWGLTGLGTNLVYQGLTGHSRLNKIMGINRYLKGSNPNSAVQASESIKVRQSITINKTPQELYRYWRDFVNLPRFMTQLESVTVLSERRSQWKVSAPAGLTVEWEAEIISDKENELIAWQSLPGARVSNAGSVQFKELSAGRGTEVKVEIDYEPPVGAIGAAIASLFGKAPSHQIQESLRNFKQIMEASEIPTAKN